MAQRTKPDFASWGWLIIFFGIGAPYALGKLGGWLGGFISQDASTYGQWVGWVLAAAYFVSAVVSYRSAERRTRRRAGHDQDEGNVQEIHVVEPPVIEIGLVNDNEPILAFDIGDNKILFLQGQWLRDPGTYETDGPAGDPYDEFVNGLSTPHSFPSSEFTISRFPKSGVVLGIRINGKYSAPHASIEALKPEYEFADSELFDGSLDDIAAVLATAHKRRRSKS